MTNEELNAINNIKNTSKKKNKKKYKSIVSKTMSKKERNYWEQKRKKAYNDRVWPGWRESDGQKSPVITYKVNSTNK